MRRLVLLDLREANGIHRCHESPRLDDMHAFGVISYQDQLFETYSEDDSNCKSSREKEVGNTDL